MTCMFAGGKTGSVDFYVAPMKVFLALSLSLSLSLARARARALSLSDRERDEEFMRFRV
jgi:hypothetical protein